MKQIVQHSPWFIKHLIILIKKDRKVNCTFPHVNGIDGFDS